MGSVIQKKKKKVIGVCPTSLTAREIDRLKLKENNSFSVTQLGQEAFEAIILWSWKGGKDPVVGVKLRNWYKGRGFCKSWK